MSLVQQLRDGPCPEMKILHHTDLLMNVLIVCITMSNAAEIIIDSWSQCVLEIMSSIDIQCGNLIT